MNIFVLGGTGAIGRPVVQELLRRNHTVTVLCRSETAGTTVRNQGARPVRGSIEDPDRWISSLAGMDALIHLAAGFSDAAANVDARLLTAVCAHADRERHRLRMIYTGGMWLFGARTEHPHSGSDYNPPAEWRWAAVGARRVLEHPGLHGVVIHPANVVDADAGVPPIILRDARRHNTIRIPLPVHATWPLVSAGTLAGLYAFVVESGRQGMEYFGIDEPAVPLSEITRRTAVATGLPATATRISIETWMREYGAWTSGYALSQTGAG